jgi:hypothetical protein
MHKRPLTRRKRIEGGTIHNIPTAIQRTREGTDVGEIAFYVFNAAQRLGGLDTSAMVRYLTMTLGATVTRATPAHQCAHFISRCNQFAENMRADEPTAARKEYFVSHDSSSVARGAAAGGHVVSGACEFAL